MTDDKTKALLPHNCILEDRRRLSVSGVNDVGNFDEETITAATEYGEMTVRGQKLHITKLSLETGELSIEGTVDSITYTDTAPKTQSFFAKVFR